MNGTKLKFLEESYGIAKGCLICGEGVPIDILRANESVICDKCKAAVMKLREEMEGAAERG